MDSESAPDREQPSFKASDVKEASGLSYRQLNDWEERGALPETEDRGSKWRKYSPRELFMIMVLAELKKQYNTPIEKLIFVKDFMTQEGANHLAAMVEKFYFLGSSQWLITDFEETFIMDTEFEVKDMFALGYFHTDEPKAYTLMNITPLVQKFMKAVSKEEAKLTSFQFEVEAEFRKNQFVKNESEAELLKKIRNSDITKVEIAMADGSIKTIKVSQKRDLNSLLKDLIKEHPFQQVSYFTRDGKIADIEQTFTFKSETKKKPKKKAESGTTGTK